MAKTRRSSAGLTDRQDVIWRAFVRAGGKKQWVNTGDIIRQLEKVGETCGSNSIVVKHMGRIMAKQPEVRSKKLYGYRIGGEDDGDS